MDFPRLHEYEPAARLEVRGPDAADFLQSQFSNDLAGAGPGRCVYGLWLDHKGKVRADGWVLCEDGETFHIVSYFSPAAALRERLEAHIIADEVEIGEAPSAGALSVYGAGAETFLEANGAAVPEAGRFTGGRGWLLFRGRRTRESSFELVFTEGAGRDRWTGSAESAIAAGEAERVDGERLRLDRIAARIPAVPDDLGPSDLPAEGGLEAEAVSFTKGCFLGQEVVARMHHVGRARRALQRVSGGGGVPAVPAPLHLEGGRAAGELRSAAAGEGRWLGLALLKCGLPGPGERLLLEGSEVVPEEGSRP